MSVLSQPYGRLRLNSLFCRPSGSPILTEAFTPALISLYIARLSFEPMNRWGSALAEHTSKE